LKKLLSTNMTYVSDEEVEALWSSIRHSSLLRGVTNVKNVKGEATQEVTESKSFARKYLEQLSVFIMDGLKNTHMRSENGALIEDKFKDSDSSVYSDMPLKDKVFYSLALFAPGSTLNNDRNSNLFRKDVNDIENGKILESKDTFAPVKTQILEAKKIQVAVNMPVQNLVKDGKLTELAKVRLRNAIKSEVHTMLDAKSKIEDIVSGKLSKKGLIKGYYFAKNTITINGNKKAVDIFGNKNQAFYVEKGKKIFLNNSQLSEVKRFPRSLDFFEWKHLENIVPDAYNALLDLVNESNNTDISLLDVNNILT